MQATAAPTSKTNGSVHQRNQTAYSVLMTNNYDLFKIMPDNRNINLLHVKRLVESFNEQYLISPIIVNERHEVIDGQHRLQACRETNKPVFYIPIKGYGIKQVQILNTNQSNWKKIDYLHSYCAEGRKPYLEFKEFMNAFPDFQMKSCERLIALNSSGRKTGFIGGQKAQMKDFEEGKLYIPNIAKSYQIARKVMDFKPYFKEFSNPTFVSSLMPLMLKSKSYEHKEMLHKLGNCPIKLTVCNDIAAYRMLLEDIYNYKRQKENKVSFRYE